jgi:geranylgeranyl diphosphate synthase type I
MILQAMDHDALLGEYTSRIEKELAPFLDNATDVGGKYHPFIGEVYDALSEFVMRKGKRLASSSTLMIYKGYTGSLDEKIMKVGIGVELNRHAILVHDDMIDRDEYRRGGRTIHEIFKRDERRGDGIALFAGNMLFSLATKSILDSGFEDDKIKEVLEIFTCDYLAVNESQMLDLDFEYKRPSEGEWYAMASKRAATLFHATILTGAILGGAPDRDISLLKDASYNIGYSFDIQDDIIGAFATEEEYGRPAGDFTYWKKPLHMVYALEMAEEKELKEIERAIGKRENVERVREIVRECGALERAKEKSKEHAARAVKLISQTDLDDATKDFFSSFIGYVSGSLGWYR